MASINPCAVAIERLLPGRTASLQESPSREWSETKGLRQRQRDFFTVLEETRHHAHDGPRLRPRKHVVDRRARRQLADGGPRGRREQQLAALESRIASRGDSHSSAVVSLSSCLATCPFGIRARKNRVS
jgi:hypothetical protein